MSKWFGKKKGSKKQNPNNQYREQKNKRTRERWMKMKKYRNRL